MKADSILDTIGNTPHVRLSRLFPDAEVWLKLERANPGGSIKDRIALAMVEDAEKKGLLKKGGTIVEPTSGNTGIGLAMVGAVKGYKVIIVMPESMSVERRRVMAVYGAQLELTPKELGINGSIAKAEEIRASIPGAWTPNQFANPANVEVHQSTTAAEVLKDFPEGFDYLITGVGTGGHISGVSEVLKSKMPKLQTYAVEPSKSPVLSGGTHSPHRLQGIGAGIIPENFHRAAVDGFIQVTEEDAFAMTLRA
ncbi:MAG: cysteine synthase family protein, partial [Gemmatimonadaceae bacterium]